MQLRLHVRGYICAKGRRASAFWVPTCFTCLHPYILRLLCHESGSHVLKVRGSSITMDTLQVQEVPKVWLEIC